MPYEGNARPKPLVPEHQADATLSQDAPVLNQWYTILDVTLNARLYFIVVKESVTGNTIEVRITIDGVTITGTTLPTGNTNYYVTKDGATGNLLFTATRTNVITGGFLEGQSVKVEMRETAQTGVVTMSGRVTYAKLLEVKT